MESSGRIYVSAGPDDTFWKLGPYSGLAWRWSDYLLIRSGMLYPDWILRTTVNEGGR